MLNITKLPRNLFVSSIVLLTASACQAPMHRKPFLLAYPVENMSMINPGWNSCSFRIGWPEESDIRFEIDLLLAHQVIAPMIQEYGGSLYRWRFHRRAARDAAGHQFSFLFYSRRDVATSLIQAVNDSKILIRLQEGNVIQSIGCTTPGDNNQSLISDSSDRQWPESIQRHWPAYIMGVSMTWLGMIDEVAAPVVSENMDIDSLVDVYTRVEEQVNTLWMEYGQHAFLHHLNAVFGYESLLIRY